MAYTFMLLGSDSISSIPVSVENLIRLYDNHNVKWIVGDNHKADRLFQDVINDINYYPNIVVYHINEKPIYLANQHWKTVRIDSSNVDVNNKDRHMIDECHKAIVIWDEQSRDTLQLIRKLKRRKKNFKLYDKLGKEINL